MASQPWTYRGPAAERSALERRAQGVKSLSATAAKRGAGKDKHDDEDDDDDDDDEEDAELFNGIDFRKVAGGQQVIDDTDM